MMLRMGCLPTLILMTLWSWAEWKLFGLVSDQFGFWRAVGGIVLAAVAGWAILTSLGARAASRMMGDLRPGIELASDALDGSIRAMSAFLLIVPGFGTDILAVMLLVPPLRRLLRHTIFRRLGLRFDFQGVWFRPVAANREEAETGWDETGRVYTTTDYEERTREAAALSPDSDSNTKS